MNSSSYILCDTEVTYTPETKKDKMCSVYFPKDCDNDCKFCTSKQFYEDNKPNASKVLKWMNSFKSSDLENIVITGGEPMSDIELLSKMLNCCDSKNVYINTTFLKPNIESFIKLVNNTDCVKGVNISRHGVDYSQDCLLLNEIAEDEMVELIDADVRINCFVGESISEEKMKKILDRWEAVRRNKRNIDVSFRHDYNKITPYNIHLLDTESIKSATKVGEYYGRVYCHVCDKLLFKTHDGMDFRIHRGLNNTRIKIGDITEMQELVLFPDGTLATDWDKTVDGLEIYLKILNIDPI